MGLLIMEPNVKRGNGKIRRRGRPETKRVPSRIRFTLVCHVQSIRERERERERKRERERERERERAVTIEYKERKERVHMHEICMNT